MSELNTRIKKMIVERLFLDVNPDEMKDDAPLMETYGVDSVALFEIVVGIEEEFDIRMEDVDFKIDSFRDVDTIAAFIQEKQGA